MDLSIFDGSFHNLKEMVGEFCGEVPGSNAEYLARRDYVVFSIQALSETMTSLRYDPRCTRKEAKHINLCLQEMHNMCVFMQRLNRQIKPVTEAGCILHAYIADTYPSLWVELYHGK